MGLGSYFNDGRPLYQSPPKQPKKKGWTKQQKERMTDEQIYSRLRDIYLAENPYCARCGNRANQVHHIVRGDAGKARSRLNSDTWLGACSEQCHDAIEKMTPEQQKKLKQKSVGQTIDRLRR